MTCKLEHCECTRETQRLFCVHWAEPEAPRDSLDAESDANWATVPHEDRKRCLDHLRRAMPAEVISKWREQYNRGNRIGSDDPRFHFSVGMNVRNCLREVLSDDKLPGALHGRHWDDFYVGALNALVTL